MQDFKGGHLLSAIIVPNSKALQHRAVEGGRRVEGQQRTTTHPTPVHDLSPSALTGTTADYVRKVLSREAWSQLRLLGTGIDPKPAFNRDDVKRKQKSFLRRVRMRSTIDIFDVNIKAISSDTTTTTTTE